jgi:hypothetical protein
MPKATCGIYLNLSTNTRPPVIELHGLNLAYNTDGAYRESVRKIEAARIDPNDYRREYTAEDWEILEDWIYDMELNYLATDLVLKGELHYERIIE